MRSKFVVFITLIVLASMVFSACAPAASTPEPETGEAVVVQTEEQAPEEKTTEEPAPEEQTTEEPMAEETGPSGEVIIAIGGDPSSLDPQAVDDGHERTVNENMYETLIARDPQTMELIPSLAISWEQVDDTTWEFKLREGVKFHNGEPFNAESVAHSVKRVIDPEYNSEQLAYYSTFVDAEVVDEYTVDVITSGSDPIVPARMYWMKMVPLEASQEEDFWQNPVGTGPYKFVEWVRNDHISMVANEEYWDDLPSIKNAEFRIIPEEITRLAALNNSEVHLVKSLVPEYVDQVPKVASVDGLEILWLRPNVILPPLDNKDLRLAINYAIDRNAIAESLYSGYADPVQGQLLTSAQFGFNPNIEPYEYNPDKAKELIAQSGYTGEEIYLPCQSGRWAKDKEVAEVVAQNLTAVGLNVRLEFVEWSAWLDLMFAPKEKKGNTISGNANELFDADRTVSAILHSEGGQSTIQDPELDRLVEEARVESDTDKREALYHEAIQIAHDEAYWAPLIVLDNIYGMSLGLQWSPRQDDKVLVKDMSWE